MHHARHQISNKRQKICWIINTKPRSWKKVTHMHACSVMSAVHCHKIDLKLLLHIPMLGNPTSHYRHIYYNMHIVYDIINPFTVL